QRSVPVRKRSQVQEVLSAVTGRDAAGTCGSSRRASGTRSGGSRPADYWGELCGSEAVASDWSDRLIGPTRMALSQDKNIRSVSRHLRLPERAPRGGTLRRADR